MEKAWQKVFANVGQWTLEREKGEAQFEHYCVSGKRKEQQCGVISKLNISDLSTLLYVRVLLCQLALKAEMLSVWIRATGASCKN